MTSPVRKRRDRARRRSKEDASELIEKAREVAYYHSTQGPIGEAAEILTPLDCRLITRAAREGWPTPQAKREEYIDRLMATLHCDDESLVLAAARTLVKLVGISNDASRGGSNA